MSILDDIVRDKIVEVNERKSRISLASLEKSALFKRQVHSMVGSLTRPQASGVIAEIKRKSPSKGVFKHDLNVVELATAYQAAGVSGISVLTETKYFSGSDDDLRQAREAVSCPILRKDFIVDEFQIVEAKAIGADIILLIAASLSSSQISSFSQLAQNVGLEVLLEVHSEEELLRSLCPTLNIIGVNNRSLATFTVNVQTSLELSAKIPAQFLKISESGLERASDIAKLRASGFSGFLIGETFMKSVDPGQACRQFIQQCTL